MKRRRVRWLQITVVMEIYLLECALYPAQLEAFVVEDCDCCCDGGCFEMKDGRRRKALIGFVYRDSATLAPNRSIPL